jgi:hypothetical protein
MIGRKQVVKGFVCAVAAMAIAGGCADADTPGEQVADDDAAPPLYLPGAIEFERVPPRPDDPEWKGAFKLSTVENMGDANLAVEDVYVEESDHYAVSFPQPTQSEVDDGSPPDPSNDVDAWPRTLEPGEAFPIRVWFRPEDNLPHQGKLIFESDDPERPRYTVELR